MGCCISSNRSSPYPSTSPTAANGVHGHAAPTSSRAHIVGSQSQLPPTASPRASHISQAPLSRPAGSPSPSPLAATPNSPLKAVTPATKIHTPDRRVWTKQRLRRERETFWETRVTNSPELWALLRVVSEAISEGRLADAQSVLDAGGCTCPTGDIWMDDSSSSGGRGSRRRRKGLAGVFDELGRCYEVPGWVVGLPAEVTEGEDDESAKAGSEEDEEDFVHEKTAESKGKGRAVDYGELIKVRARLSDRGTDVVVKVGELEPIRGLVARVRDFTGIPSFTKVRIAYLGKVLNEQDSLPSQGWRPGHVVNVMIFS